MLNIGTIEEMTYDILIKNNNNNVLSNIKSWLLEDTQIKLLKGIKGDNNTIENIISKCNLKNIKGKSGISYDSNLLLESIKNWLIQQRDIIKGSKGEYLFMEHPPINYDIYNNDIINYLNNNKFTGSTGSIGFSMRDIIIENNILRINYIDNITYTSNILKGLKGDDMYDGITGYDGCIGKIGNTGYTGVAGQPGYTGVTGQPGIDGIKGIIGDIGSIGKTINIQDYLNPLYYISLLEIDNYNIYNCSDLSEILDNFIFINNYQSYIIKYKSKNIHYINNIEYSNQNDNRLYEEGIFKPMVNGDWNIINKIIVELNYNRLNKSCCLVLVTYIYSNNIWKIINFSIETIYLNNSIITLMNNNILYLNENNNLMTILFLYGDIPNKINLIGSAEFRLINLKKN
jgi:hypothetical protein